MQKILLSGTTLSVSRTAFGCIPIQRIPVADSTAILRRAYDSGVNFYDTARAYTDSEARIGLALGELRHNIVLATKSFVRPTDDVLRNLEISLSEMKTDYIDLFQVHNPGFLPMPGGQDGVYDNLVKAKAQGKIRFIGITSHKLPLAVEAVRSGLYDTLQYPLSLLSSQAELEIVELCRKNNVGLIAMKAMAGGILSNAKAAFAFLRQFENVVPIWGIMRMKELEEFLQYEQNPPQLDEELISFIEAERAELGSVFCRGCGYCQPCPAGIRIETVARMDKLLRRASLKQFLTDQWYSEMKKIENCIACGQCTANCPYSLDPPALMRANLVDFSEMYALHHEKH